MKDGVSFEMAKRLKEAGFPQPSVKITQVWFSSYGRPYFAQRVGGGSAELARIGGIEIVIVTNFAHWTFGPSATDILGQLPDKYRLTRVNQTMFICTEKEAVIGDDGCNDNPAEAAAAAWLALNKKKDETD